MMPKHARPFQAVVTVWAEIPEQATQVMSERIGPDEDYGFDYQIDWSAPWATDWPEEKR